MCLGCCNASIQNAGRSFTDNNAAYSRSGSVGESNKFDGPSASNNKFEGQKSNSGNNPHIGQEGWGS
jgi:hypothetical protein